MRRGGGGGINPAGEASGVPGEHRGGLIGEDLWVWEEKAEAGLGRGQDKRKRGRAARRGRTPPGSGAAAVPSRVLSVVVVGPPFPSLSFPPAFLPQKGLRAGRERKGPPGIRSSPPEAQAGAAPRGRRQRPADSPGSGRAPGEERLEQHLLAGVDSRGAREGRREREKVPPLSFTGVPKF